MPSAAERRTAGAGLAIALAALLAAAAVHAQAPGGPAADAPSDADVDRAVATVRADPNLTMVRTIRVLRWRDSEPQPEEPSAFIEWLTGLFQWLARSARLLMWALVAVLAGVLILYVARILHVHRRPQPLAAFIAPTHVRDLDIRPESLPSDIGRAARQLWDRGEHRAALALLYRGLLSRLAHVHQVPIRDSSTEGDCLALASAHLTSERHAYALRLVSVRQRAVYGAQRVETSAVHGLCGEFAAMLDASSPSGAAAGPGEQGVPA